MTLGNLLNRTIAMINQYFGGEIPVYEGSITPYDSDLQQTSEAVVKEYEEAMESMEFSVALASVWNLINQN